MTEWICAECRKACRLRVETDAEGRIRVSGNQCPKGEEFGRAQTAAAAAAANDPTAKETGAGADWWERSYASREMHEIHHRMKSFGCLLKQRRRAIRPAQWRRIRSVLDGSFREIEALLSD